jgi:hypothetical protein
MRVTRYFAAAGVAVGTLSGCGQSQMPTSYVARSTVSQPSRIVRVNGSWMAPEAKAVDLLYTVVGNQVDVLTYPQGQMVGQLSGFEGSPQYLCVGKAGDLFVTVAAGESNVGAVYEFRHGGSHPIVKLTDPGWIGGCSVDLTTGDLAVANRVSNLGRHHAGTIVIFRKARGTPRVYRTRNMNSFLFCTYDVQGNLLTDGGNDKNYFGLAMLTHTKRQFEIINLNKSITKFGPVQWDGKYFAVGFAGTHALYQIAVSGSTATVVKTIRLRSKRRMDIYYFWVQSNTILGLLFDQQKNFGAMAFWPYPAGGEYTQYFNDGGSQTGVNAVAVSLAL